MGVVAQWLRHHLARLVRLGAKRDGIGLHMPAVPLLREEGCMTTYIGIDPAIHTGWAVLNDDGKRLASGVWDLSSRKSDGGGMVFVRFRRLFRELLNEPFYDGPMVGNKLVTNRFPGQQVAFEQYVNHFPGAAQPSAGFQAQIQEECELRGIPYAGVSPGAIKRTATGRGNASKGMMQAAANHQWFPAESAPVPEDEADALWIAETLRRGLL
jgi:Holliday junction resolvasome RuvABC endonuclease subunit